MRQVYIIREKGKFWRHKIGVAKSPKGRAAQIGNKLVWTSVPSYDPFACEQALHKVFAPLHHPRVREDGGTEWFFTINLIVPAIVYPVALYFDVEWVAWVLAVCFQPLDALFVLWLAFVVQWSPVLVLLVSLLAALKFI